MVAPAVDGRLHDFAQKVELGPRGVLRAELDVRTVALGPSHAFDGLVDDLGLAHPQLVFAMDGGSGEEDVNSGFLCELDRLPGAVDIAFVAPRQAADRRRR